MVAGLTPALPKQGEISNKVCELKNDCYFPMLCEYPIRIPLVAHPNLQKREFWEM